MKKKTSDVKTQDAREELQVCEVVAPCWERARQLLEGIKMHLRLSLAGQVAIGHELLFLKQGLGYAGTGKWKSKDDTMSSLNRTWDDWCKSELGVSNRTADRWIECYDACKARLKKLGGEARLLTLIETPPAQMDAEAQRTLAAAVEKVVDGASQKLLLEELKLVKTHVALLGGDTSEHRAEPAPEQKLGQLAFAFFQPLGQSLASLHSCPEYKAYLAALPVVSTTDDELSLSVLERELEMALDDVRAAKKSHV